jgi:NAD(P)-dependent dehydrogenase (short-subunit alcohol dehydrogenase family)
MPTVLVTGASRGLGLEFARQYAAAGWSVIATARDPAASAALAGLAQAPGAAVSCHALDVTDHAAIDALAERLAGTKLDLLINNAGGMGAHTPPGQGMLVQRFGRTHYADWRELLELHVLAPMKMAEAFSAALAAGGGGTLVTLSSVLGSMTENTLGGLYAYRSSKAAVNAVMRSLARDLARHGIIAVPLHPGWVATELGGASAPLTPEASVAGLRAVIAGLTPAHSGRFFQYDGKELPW